MNTSGDAAEQVFRMSLDGVQMVLRVTGAGAKNLILLLYAIFKDQKRTKGKVRIASMLRSGKELDVFSVKESDLRVFAQEAKQYGILYAAIRDPKGSPDGMVDVMVKKEDATRINRIVERFKFAVVDTASVKAEIEQSRAGKTPDAPEITTPDKSAEDKLLDELFEKPVQKETAQPENPTPARTEKSPPSEPTSTKSSKAAEGTSKPPEKSDASRPSVRQELKDIKAAREKQADTPKREDIVKDDKSKSSKGTQHKQPQNNRKKSKKSKAR